MISILIVTHGQFGRELIRSAELIVGKQNNINFFGLEHGESAEELSKTIFNWIFKQNEQGYDVLVLTDLFGGTPTNVTLANMEKLKFKCITGINLPMLIEIINASSDKSTELNKLAEWSCDVGRNGIRYFDFATLQK